MNKKDVLPYYFNKAQPNVRQFELYDTLRLKNEREHNELLIMSSNYYIYTHIYMGYYLLVSSAEQQEQQQPHKYQWTHRDGPHKNLCTNS